MAFFKYLLDISVLLFPVASMLAVGLSFTLQQIARPLRYPDRVFRAIVANFVLVPLLALLISHLLQLEPALSNGTILVGTAAGAPFLLKLTQVANADVSLGASLLVLLMPLTVVYMPLVVPVLIEDISVSALRIAMPLVLTMLLPLVIGHALDSFLPRLAVHLRPVATRTSTVSLLVLIVSTVILNAPQFLDLGITAVVAAGLLTAGGFGMGYLLSSQGFNRRTVMGLGAGQRNIAAALVVASQDFADLKTLVMVVLFSVVDLMVLFPFALLLRRSSPLRKVEDENSSLHRPGTE